MSLATKLKELRIKKGQSLQQVGDAVSLSKAHVWELEMGRSRNPGIDVMKRLADHFGVTISYLLDEVNPTGDARTLQFFREFEGKLTEKDWDALHGVAKRLTERSQESDE
jgi:transcriptional regulator with XRE-family HTH domain